MKGRCVCLGCSNSGCSWLLQGSVLRETALQHVVWCQIIMVPVGLLFCIGVTAWAASGEDVML
jgi:hypothetical protein